MWLDRSQRLSFHSAAARQLLVTDNFSYILINVEASAISRDERKFRLLFLQKYPFTKRLDEEKKGSRSLDQIARTFSLFVPPKHILAPAATAYK